MDETTVQPDDCPHQIVSVCPVAPFVLLEALYLHVERLLFKYLSSSEMEEL